MDPFFYCIDVNKLSKELKLNIPPFNEIITYFNPMKQQKTLKTFYMQNGGQLSFALKSYLFHGLSIHSEHEYIDQNMASQLLDIHDIFYDKLNL